MQQVFTFVEINSEKVIYVVLKNKHKELCTGTQHFLTSQMWVLWASIVHWICLRLPSCCPGFESQAHHLHFYQFIFELCHMEKTIIKKKRPEFPIFLKHRFLKSRYPILTDSATKLQTYWNKKKKVRCFIQKKFSQLIFFFGPLCCISQQT